MATIKEFTNYTGQETIYPVTVAQAVYVDNTKTVSQALNELTPSTTTPQNVATTGQVGQAVKYARGDHVHGIQLATGDNNGQVKIAGTNVDVKGLAALAYKASLGKADVGLGNIDNTSDLNKPISTATQTALDGKSPLAGSSSLTTVASDVTYGDSGFKVVTSKVAGGASKQIGWYRIASVGVYTAGIICHQGGYNTGWPTCAVCSFQTQNTVASIVQLAGVPKQIFNKYRLIRDTSSGLYYIDAYQAQDYTSGTMGAQIFTIVGNSSQPITALNPTEPTDDTTTAAAECTIVNISGGYLPLKGGTLSGTLTVKGNQYTDSYTGALNMANSNIYGLNSIYTADGANNASEGIHFYRDATHVDTLWMNGGDLLFVPNRALGTSTSKADSQKVGRFTANPTTGQVVITDGTTGGMKSSGYTIETSVPSGAKFTDTTYTFDTGDNNGQIKVTPLGGQAQNVQVKGLAALAYKASLGKADVGLGNVDNKSSATIRGEITSQNVTTALGYTPVNQAGDTMTGMLTAPTIKAANTAYGVAKGRTTGTPKETILYTGIKWVSSAHMPVLHLTGYAYGLQSPVEFKIGFYIYGDKIDYCGAVNMGAWNPQIYLFKYTVNDVSYVAVGFVGQCYFLQLAVDVQSEMGNFQNIDLTSSLWHFDFLTTTGNIPADDGGTTCNDVPYKADILNPAKVNNHTVESNVPSNAKFTDTWNANSKTADGYVTKGQGNQNMFWGTDNEGNPGWRVQTLDVSSATGILSVAHGGTGVSSFTSGKVLVGAADGSIGYKDIVSISTAGSISGSDDLISANALSLWDGSFGSGNSNIKYTQLGELKSGAIKTSTQDLAIATDGYVLDARAGKTLKGLIDTASQKATAQEQWVQAHSKVENKTSTEILSELTKANVTAALEYEPPHKYTGSSGIIVDNEAYTITNTGILTLAEGTTNGAFNYTSTAGGGSIPIHGLKSAAYLAAQNYAASETSLHKKHVGLDNVDNTADADKVVKEAGVAVKLKTPITVKIADATVTNVDWQSNLTITKPQLGLKLNDINPIVSGRYNGVIAEGDTHDTATFYFANLKPTSYYGVWKVRYRIYAIIASDADSSAMSDVEIWGSGQSVTAYKVFNAHRNTNNRPYYNHKVYHATEAGVATYGHIIGVDLSSSNHPTDANYSRSVAVDVLEAENCTVEMFPVVNLYPQVPGSGSTNYSAVSTFNGCTNGLQETGDLDTYDRVRFSSAIPAGDDIVSGNIIVMAVGSAYVHLNSGQAFYIGPPPLYAGQAIASGSQGTNNYAVFPVTIATTQALTMAQGQTVFIKGTVNGRIFTPVSETPLVAGAPSTEDSYSYMVLGYACSDTVMYLLPEHPIFAWKDGQFGTSVDSARYANRAGDLVSTTDPTSLDIAGGTQTLHYYIAGGGTGNNRPAWGSTVASGTVLSMDWVSGQHATQLAQGVARSGQLAVRAKYNGTWSGWNYVFDSAHKPTKADVGLGNVDNTSDANKPVSTAQKTKIENDDATTLASAKSYADGLASDLQTAVNTKANDSAVVKLTGNQSIAGHKTFTDYFVANERAILKDGFYVHSAVGTSGSTGYVKVCDITLENTYGDQPVYFTFVRRGDQYPTVVSVLFTGGNGADPDLSQITCFGYTNDVWITKSAVSTWGVYILKTGGYDRIDIMDSNRGNYNSARVHFVWTDVLASSVPAGLVGRTQASYGKTLYVEFKNDEQAWHRVPFIGGDSDSSMTRNIQQNDGLKYFWNPGVESSSTAGRGILRLGNQLLQTADGGARGELWLCGREASYYNVLVPQAGLTENVTNQIPYKAGILLNSSDLSQTKSGTLILSKTNAASATANNGPALMVGGTATTAHIEIDKNQIMAKSNATTVTGLSLGVGGTVTISGPLHLTRETDAAGTQNTDPALSIGNRSGAHIEIDGNEIMAKASGTTVGSLYINTNGGTVQFGPDSGNKRVVITDGVVTASGVAGTAGGILRPILWGTAAATTSNCPNGCVYFRYS